MTSGVEYINLIPGNLLLRVPWPRVFLRPWKSWTSRVPDHISPEETAADQKALANAWIAAAGVGQVYKGIREDRQLCYVVVTPADYDPVACPKPEEHPDAMKRKSTKQSAVRAQKRKRAERIARVAAADARFEIVPKVHACVDYGCSQRVIIRTASKVLLYRPGVRADVGGGSTAYFRAAFSIRKWRPEDTKGSRRSDAVCGLDSDRTRYVVLPGRPDSVQHEVPLHWRYSPQAVEKMLWVHREAMKIPENVMKDWAVPVVKTMTLLGIP